MLAYPLPVLWLSKAVPMATVHLIAWTEWARWLTVLGLWTYPMVGVLCSVVIYEFQQPGRVARLSDAPHWFLGTCIEASTHWAV